jgi:hypothetical protein
MQVAPPPPPLPFSQRPLSFPSSHLVSFVSLGEGDYTARGLEQDAVIERESPLTP